MRVFSPTIINKRLPLAWARKGARISMLVHPLVARFDEVVYS